jgi:hypothetical protein
VLTLCDGQLAVPASNSTLCGYILEYYSEFVFITAIFLLYCLISTVNVTGSTVLTLCDGQLAVPASNCTLCGYVLEYYSALFVCLSELMFFIWPYIYC